MCVFWTLRSSAAHPSCDDAALGLPNQCTATPDRLDGSSFVTFRGGFAPHSSRLTNCSAMRRPSLTRIRRPQATRNRPHPAPATGGPSSVRYGVAGFSQTEMQAPLVDLQIAAAGEPSDLEHTPGGP